MIPSVPPGVEIAVIVVAANVPIAALLTPWIGGRGAGVRRPLSLGALTMGAALVWGGIVLGLDALKIGWGAAYSYTPVAVLIGFVLPQLIALGALRRAPRLRAALSSRAGLSRLASVQMARNLGVVFLILHAQGKLPGLFAYPAAWEDIAIGVTAPLAMWLIVFRESELRRRGSPWQRAFIAWNLLGLSGHVMAVTLGITNFPGLTRVFYGHASTVMFAVLPMALFPLYMVPFADTLHLAMIDLVRRPELAERHAHSERPAARPAATIAAPRP